jgi:hypothetical protein
MLPLAFAAPAADVAPAAPALAPQASTSAASPAAGPAAAGPATPSPDAEAPRKVRNGVVLGLSFGLAIGRGSGYPNDSNDIGHTDYESSGWIGGGAGTVLVMGAIADYLNFGFWYAHTSLSGGGHRAAADGIGLRVEAFPFVFASPYVAGLGLFTEFGLGTARLSTPGLPNAAGTQSFIGTGAFYEWAVGRVLGGHFGIGPSLEYDAVFTQPYDQNGLVASLRAVWYGGP